MYPKNNLYKIYEKINSIEWISCRLPDLFKVSSLGFMNSAINCTEHWNNFLDVGANNGHYSAALIKKFKNGCAVEAVKSEELEKVGQNNPGLQIRYDDIQNINFEQKFDFILLSDVFEHIPLDDVDAFVAKMSSIQAPGGVIYISTPNPMYCGPAEESIIYYTKDPYGHRKHYTKDEIDRIFGRFDYEIVYHCYEEYILKNTFRRYLLGLFRRDNKLMRNKIYSWVSFPFVFFINNFFKVISLYIYAKEKKGKVAATDGLTQLFILKKRFER